MGEICINQAYRQTLTAQTYNLFEYLLHKAELVKGSLCTIIQKASLALEVDKDRKTLDKYLKELEKEGAVLYGTKRGRNGGTLVLFSDDAVTFPTTETIINSKEKVAELMDHFYPRSPKKVPEKNYRSKQEILREKFFQSEAKKEELRLNALLVDQGYPTIDFFNELESPLIGLRAYLLSRLYNSFVVIYPNERKDYYESAKDENNFERASKQLDGYKDYDCLEQEFVGTQAFNHFLKLANLLENAHINPVDYLTSQFSYMNYLEMVGNKKVGLPFVNTLWSKESFNRHINNYDFWETHYKSHPYFKPAGDMLKSVAWKYPIVTAIMAVYEDPSQYKDRDSYQDIIDTIESMGYVSNKQRLVITFFRKELLNVANSELETKEKQTLTDYLKRQFSLGLGLNKMTPTVYVTTFPKETMSRILEYSEDATRDLRTYYKKIGNVGKVREFNMNDEQMFVRSGYLYDFTMTANKSFPPTLFTIASIRRITLDTETLDKALKSYGEGRLPIGSDGMIDLDMLYKTYLSEKEREEDIKNYKLFHIDDQPIDNGTNMWYDIVNAKDKKQYGRDGSRIVL